MIFNPVIVDSGNITVERAISIQSLRSTPATRIVSAPVLPITKKIEKFNAKAHSAFEKKIQKLNWIWVTCMSGFSNKYQGTNRKTKLHESNTKSEQLIQLTPIKLESSFCLYTLIYSERLLLLQKEILIIHWRSYLTTSSGVASNYTLTAWSNVI